MLNVNIYTAFSVNVCKLFFTQIWNVLVNMKFPRFKTTPFLIITFLSVTLNPGLYVSGGGGGGGGMSLIKLINLEVLVSPIHSSNQKCC